MSGLKSQSGGGYLLSNNECYIWIHDENINDCGLTDYKWYCFNGIPKVVMINSDRHTGRTKADYFDTDYNHLDFMWGYPHADEIPKKPKRYDEMELLAAKLSNGIPHVRVDFYDVNGKIYFGEMTFFDGSGFDGFEPQEWDYKFGEWLKLPTVERGSMKILRNRNYDKKNKIIT